MKEIIFAPDLIGASFLDSKARAILGRWRDGEFKVVLNRELLTIHLKILRDLGLSVELLQRWTLCLTSPEKSIFLSDLDTAGMPSQVSCERIAEIAQCKIICWKKPDGANANWVTVDSGIN